MDLSVFEFHNENMKFILIFSLLNLSANRLLACEPVIPAVVNLEVNSYYSDKKSSVIDEVKKEKHDAAVEPLESFMKVIAKESDNYLGAKKSKEAGRCAVDWILNWAKESALTGEMKSEQAFYERKWMLAGIALVYAKVRNEATEKEKSKIQSWLSELADLTIEHSDHYKGPRNNHYYWEGLAVGAVGKLTRKDRYLTWARTVFASALDEIQEDGSLPKEISRGKRALHYHIFSAAPLVFLSSILDLDSSVLTKFVEFTFHGIKDPSTIAKLAGVPQETEKDSDMAWIEVYLRRHPNDVMEDFVKEKRPLRYVKLGGNLSIKNPLEAR
jgi:poly(beta-D-mannuronate) lyase